MHIRDTSTILKKRETEFNIYRHIWNFVFTISKHSGESTRTFHSPDLTCETRKPALGFLLFHEERFIMRIFFE